MSLMTGANNANFCTSVYVVSYGRVGAWCEAHEDRFICMPPDSLIRYLGIYVLVVLRGCVDLCGRREGGMGREWVRKGVGGGGCVLVCVWSCVSVRVNMRVHLYMSRKVCVSLVLLSEYLYFSVCLCNCTCMTYKKFISVCVLDAYPDNHFRSTRTGDHSAP